MIDLLKVASELQHGCEERGLPFCIIGGVAVQRWGRVRVTNDVDGVIFTGLGGEDDTPQRELAALRRRMGLA